MEKRCFIQSTWTSSGNITFEKEKKKKKKEKLARLKT